MNILSEACDGGANKINSLEHVQVRQKFKQQKNMNIQYVVRKLVFVHSSSDLHSFLIMKNTICSC